MQIKVAATRSPLALALAVSTALYALPVQALPEQAVRKVVADEKPDVLAPAISAILQTDGPRARRLLNEALISPEASKRDVLLAKCSLARLNGEASVPLPAMSGNAFADQVITIYRAYWTKAMDPAIREQAEIELFDSLRNALDRADLADRDAILTEVSKRLNAKGIRTAQGRTAALFDLILYLSEEKEKYNVELTDGTIRDIDVFFMHEIVSFGWSRYFTCGSTGTGGFSAPNGVYAVAEMYDKLSENFEYNYLAHETRHYVDDEIYPGMPGTVLEYRAKLTQLGLIDRTMTKELELFESDQSDDPDNPHSHANKRVIAALREELALAPDADLTKIDPNLIRAAARKLLLEDNEERNKAFAS